MNSPRAKPTPVIIDVRESEEYADGFVARAKHLSRGVLEQKIADVVPDFSTPIVLYCDRGERAALAAENLLKMGYQYVRSLQGGLQNWLESGGELEVSSRFSPPVLISLEQVAFALSRVIPAWFPWETQLIERCRC